MARPNSAGLPLELPLDALFQLSRFLTIASSGIARHLLARNSVAIDVQEEQVVSLREACGLLPRRRAGKKPAIETLYRWSLRGCRGIKLETVQVGATRCTSVEALQRFFDALTAASDAANTLPTPAPVATKSRRKAIQAATAFCESSGI